MHVLKRKVSLSALKFGHFGVWLGVSEMKFHTLALIRAESIVAFLVFDVV
jgi:hypothetical protein